MDRRGRRRPFRRLLTASAMLLTLSAVAFSSTPRATMPPSSYQSGLIGVPNPMDGSGNLPITGNVAGGKHFRGNIPYNSTTSFGAPLGSTSLDPFLRYSAGPDAQAGYLRGYSPFYSSTGTVTATLPGRQGVFSPVSPRIAGGPGQPLDVMTMTEVAEPKVSAQDNWGVPTSPRLGYVPMSMNSGEAKDTLPQTPSDILNQRSLSPPGDSLMTPQEYQQRLDQLLQGIERMQASLSQPQQSPVPDGPAQPPVRQPAPEQQTVTSPEPQLELYDPSAAHQATVPMIPAESEQTDDAIESGTLAALKRIEEISKSANRTSREQPSPSEQMPREVAQPAPAQPPVQAPKQTDKTVDSVTQRQFDQYLAAAQAHMQQGRYDRAVEAFRLASVYIPHDPRPHFGKCLALLAAGDCTGSAMALIRTIELDAKLALQRVDLVAALGGPDLFVERVSKLQEQVEAGGIPQLQILMAYVYFEMNQVNEAAATIQAVRAATPDSQPARLLEAAIRAAR